MKQKIQATRSQLAQALFYLKGEPLSFEKHQYMIEILNGTWPMLLLKSSRQVGKSTMLSLLMLLDIIANPKKLKAIRELYVSPSLMQTKTFSIEKLRPMIKDSPRFMALAFDPKTSQDDVFTKTFKNGAMIFLRGAYRDAERIRGIPVDLAAVDEIQSMLRALLPVIFSALDASSYGRIIMAGTPLTPVNPIEDYWNISTKTEWVVPCHRHTPTFWNVLGPENIGKEGLICKKCGKPINPAEGKWIDMVPGATVKGFRITQLAVSWKQDPERWKSDIVYKMENWPEDKFLNETLGLTAGAADTPITMEMIKKVAGLKDTAWDTTVFHDDPPTRRLRWFAGVDWGEGKELSVTDNSGKKKYTSYTIFVIGAYGNDGRFHLAHWKKFKGLEANPEFILNYIRTKIKEWNIDTVGVDWGFGWGVNNLLINEFGLQKIVPIYHSANLKSFYKWDNEGSKIILNRNAAISRLINDIKKLRIGFPKLDLIKEMIADFLSIYAEYNYSRNVIQYEHPQEQPDDSLHAVLYAKFIADLRLGKL